MDPGQLYADTRARITELVRSLDDEALRQGVPATPGWTVKDLVGHLAGVIDDVSAGRIEGAASDPWTDAQVQARRDTAVAEILDEWTAKAPAIEEQLAGFGPAAQLMVGDAVIHEQDLREALDRPGGTDAPAYEAVLQGVVSQLGKRLDDAGVGALRIVAGNEEWVVGSGEPAATLTAPDRHELFRAVTGRRSLLTMANWEWDGEFAPYLDHLPMFPPPADQPDRAGDPPATA